MPTTSNFGWTTPADTDLVKDGAAAIRTLGNGIDTSFLDLKGGTTDQVLAKNSNTDLDFKWVAQDDSNAIQNAIVDAKGDLISATAADTPARLAVGANGTVLTADSAEATGLKWAAPAAGGGLTLINTGGTALTGSSTTYSSIPTTYKNLIVIARNFYVSSANANGAVRFNSDTSSTYSIGAYRITPSLGNTSGGNQGADRFYLMEQMGTTDTDNFVYFIIPDYANADTHKVIEGVTKYQTGDSPGVDNARFFYGMWTTAPAAITSLTFISSANWSGGTFFIYGES